ncbi:MAG: hypothetical protein M2R45_01026 [Verrucomicrobia subdivision 3 bacterium]|nr:hypothetical protein [Limisphaerales bacterium]MCS1414138.1 hypothetical protein [Limisphaerales bacterium]
MVGAMDLRFIRDSPGSKRQPIHYSLESCWFLRVLAAELSQPFGDGGRCNDLFGNSVTLVQDSQLTDAESKLLSGIDEPDVLRIARMKSNGESLWSVAIIAESLQFLSSEALAVDRLGKTLLTIDSKSVVLPNTRPHPEPADIREISLVRFMPSEQGAISLVFDAFFSDASESHGETRSKWRCVLTASAMLKAFGSKMVNC